MTDKHIEAFRNRAIEYFDYNPSSGILTYKERPKEQFKLEMNYRGHLSRIGKPAAHRKKDGYLWLWVDGKKYKAHRIIWMMVHGNLPEYPEYCIDHINGNRSDNRISNLRETTLLENSKNYGRRIDNSSGVAGVHWHSRDMKWVARIRHDGKQITLGSFINISDAAEARRNAEKQFGYPVLDRLSHRVSPRKGSQI